MKVIIAGSRDLDIPNIHELIHFAVKRSGFKITQLLSGCARGVDREAMTELASMLDEDNIIGYTANWKTFGKSAGFIRNVQMAEDADALILIWNGRSSGSAHMKDQMVRRGKPIYELIENKSLNAEEHKFRM